MHAHGLARSTFRSPACTPTAGLSWQVLEETGFAEERSAKMDIDDFMLLLSRFNEAGLHFSGGHEWEMIS